MSEKNPLISNIPPPTELPSFVLQQKPAKENEQKSEKPETSSFASNSTTSTTTFNPVIPTEKNITSPAPQQEVPDQDVQAEEVKEELPSMQDIANALSPLTDGVKNSVLFGWVKDSVKIGVQKAKESVDKVVTTLDPQMSQIIYSGGDTEIVVASSNDDKIMSVREAFQSVFGRATVYGHSSQAKSVAAQPVGFEAAELAAKERINSLRSNENFIDKVILAVENFVVEIYKNQWFDLGLLIISDPRRNITLKSFTQMTFVPSQIITSLEADTPKDYDRRETGFSQTVGAAMARNLNTPHYEWHKTYTTIDRTEMITSAALALASIYKLELQSKVPAQAKIDDTK